MNGWTMDEMEPMSQGDFWGQFFPIKARVNVRGGFDGLTVLYFRCIRRFSDVEVSKWVVP